MKRTIEERFFAKVVKQDDGCWIWTGAKDIKRQVGYFNPSAKKSTQATRASWSLANGDIPGGAQVLGCRASRLCVNPAHLRLVTADDVVAHARIAGARGPIARDAKPTACKKCGTLRFVGETCAPCSAERYRARAQTAERKAYKKAAKQRARERARAIRAAAKAAMPVLSPEEMEAARKQRLRETRPHLHREAAYRRKYGLELREVRALLEAQGDACGACRCPLDFMRARDPVTRRLLWVVDHDHATLRIRGILCDPCNFILGIAKDNAARLRGAADYLDSPPAGSALVARPFANEASAKAKRSNQKRIKRSSDKAKWPAAQLALAGAA